MSTTDPSSSVSAVPAVIALANADGSAWAERLAERVPAGFALVRCTDRAGIITRLAADHAALLIVDGTRPGDDWRFWTVTPKASPATRRIPVLFVAEEADRRAAALLAGADLALGLDEALRDLPRILAEHARRLDPEAAAQLDCDCGGTLPDLAEQGVERFNAGEFYAQHDLFEALWVQTERPVRDLYRAILQVGVAYYQILRGNPRGARKMLLRSVQWLTILPDTCQGIDVRQLREDSARVRAALETLPGDDLTGFDRALLRPVRRVGGKAGGGDGPTLES